MDRFYLWWEKLRTGLWPIPLGMALLAVVLYATVIRFDARTFDEQFLRTWHLYSGAGDDARNLLTTLVSAIITMSSVVFSITIVALSLGANQFGSRLVRTYMADIRTKLALGLFTMTIVYCLLALRAIEQDMPAAEVPHVTVSIGLLLALACVLALLFFLHFVARSIVADQVIRRVVRELEENIEELPDLSPADPIVDPSTLLPVDFEQRCAIVRARKGGYVEAVEYDDLLALAIKHNLWLRFDFRAGAFISKNGWLARVYPGEALTSALASSIQECILIGSDRTPTQDLEFVIRHVVDIALRALSPGINDANTSLVVIDHLSGALSLLTTKRIPNGICRDDHGVVRVLGKYNDYRGIIDAALRQIRQAAADQPAVIIQLLRALARIGEHVTLAEQRDALLHHAQLTAAAGLRDLEEAHDRADIEAAFASTQRKLKQIDCGSAARSCETAATRLSAENRMLAQ